MTRQWKHFAYLTGVHLELSDNLDTDFGVLALSVFRPVDVAEGAIAHLLYQLPSLQTWILRHLPFALSLLSNNALENGGIDIFLALLSLLLFRSSCSYITCLSGDISVVSRSGRETTSSPMR